MQNFESDSIAAGGYDDATSCLRLRFVEGGLYEYSSVPPRVWAELKDAESKGGYFHAEILDRYAYRKVT